MDRSLKIEQNELRAVCSRYEVRKLSLYSSIARGEARYDSDVDPLVEFTEEARPSLGVLVRLEDELSNLLDRRLRLATTGILRNPYRRQSILPDLEEVTCGLRIGTRRTFWTCSNLQKKYRGDDQERFFGVKPVSLT